MTVLCKGHLFDLLLLETMINHELWLHHCNHPLEDNQAKHNPASIKFMDVLKNILVGIQGSISIGLDVVLGNEVNRAREATESNLVAIN